MMVNYDGVSWVHADCEDNWQSGVSVEWRDNVGWQGIGGWRGRQGATKRAKKSPLIAEWEATRKSIPVGGISVQVDKDALVLQNKSQHIDGPISTMAANY
jgi:hypothetical protein